MSKTNQQLNSLILFVIYKDGQRQQWNQVAAGWRRWWPLFEKGAQGASEQLVKMAQLQSGQRVLDIATGVGEPALTAAHRVGTTGQVIATDQAQQMLTIAQERATIIGLHNITFYKMDAEALNLPQDVFDAILCRFGMMFLPHLPSTLRQLRALLKSGGRLATAVWDVPSQVPMLSLPMRVIRQFIDVPPPPAGVPNPFNLANVAAFERTLTEAGFINVQHERIQLTWDLASGQEFIQMAQDTAAPILALLANQPADQQAEIWQAMAAEIEHQYGTANGRVAFPQ